MVKKDKPKATSLHFSILINLVFIIFSPIILSVIAAFSISYILVHQYLKTKYGKVYGGLLPSGDALWKIEDNSRPIINVCCIVDTDSDKPEDLTRIIKTMFETGIRNNPQKFSKFTSSCRTFLGYGYLLRDKVKVEDCVTVVDTANITDKYLNKEKLTEFMSVYGNRALPMNHEALWELIFIPKAIGWTDNKKLGTRFAFIWRCSHVLGDGFTLFDQMLTLFTKENDKYKNIFNESVRKVFPKSKIRPTGLTGTMESIMESLGKAAYFCWYFAPVVVGQFFFNECDDNALHGPDLTKDKHLVFAVEEEKKLLTATRDIRGRMKDVSFSTVVFTAFSASLNNYFHKLSLRCPDDVSLVLLGMFMKPKEDGSFVGPDNKFSVALLTLPVNTGPDMIQRLEAVKRSSNILARSPDFFVNHIITNHLLGIIPLPIMKILYAPNIQTASVSIVPGIPEKVQAEGFTIRDIIFHTPHKGRMGINVSVLTYDNRFQLGLIVDKRIIPNVRDAQFMVDEVARQIHKLHDAVVRHT